jgi:hypothetical protein
VVDKNLLLELAATQFAPSFIRPRGDLSTEGDVPLYHFVGLEDSAEISAEMGDLKF